jgi:hypothetical protein
MLSCPAGSNKAALANGIYDAGLGGRVCGAAGSSLPPQEVSKNADAKTRGISCFVVQRVMIDVPYVVVTQRY